MNTIIQILSEIKYKKCNNVLKKLSLLPYAHIKGEALSIQAYGAVGQRNSSDIDLLISKKHIPEVKKILLEDGFEPIINSREDEVMALAFSHQIPSWKKEIPPFGVVFIDVNFDIFWGEYKGKRIDIDEFVADFIEIDIYGYKTKILTPIKALVQLMLHIYKDMNSIFLISTRKQVNLKMFEDVKNMIVRNRHYITIQELYEISETFEILPYMYYVLYYTYYVTRDDTVGIYAEALKTYEGIRILNFYGLNENEQKTWKFGIDERLQSKNLYELIKDDLDFNEKKKIEINSRIF